MNISKQLKIVLSDGRRLVEAADDPGRLCAAVSEVLRLTGMQALVDFCPASCPGVPCSGNDLLRKLEHIEALVIDIGSDDERSLGLAYLLALARNQLGMIRIESGPLHVSLTPRENQCLRLLAHGRRTLSICADLGLKEITVHMHVRNAREKLGAKTREEAVARALQLGLIGIDLHEPQCPGRDAEHCASGAIRPVSSVD